MNETIEKIRNSQQKLHVLQLVQAGYNYSRKLQDPLEMSHTGARKHLTALEDAGYLTSEKKGNRRIYTVDHQLMTNDFLDYVCKIVLSLDAEDKKELYQNLEELRSNRTNSAYDFFPRVFQKMLQANIPPDRKIIALYNELYRNIGSFITCYTPQNGLTATDLGQYLEGEEKHLYNLLVALSHAQNPVFVGFMQSMHEYVSEQQDTELSDVLNTPE